MTVFTNRENSNREVVVLGDYTRLVQETYSSGCPNLGQVHGTQPPINTFMITSDGSMIAR